MNNAAQNNGSNLSYPTFNDGANPQPNTASNKNNTQTQSQSNDLDHDGLNSHIDTCQQE